MPLDPYQSVLDALSAKRRVLITTHARPDGDALGSTAAMAMALRRKTIDSRILLFERLPDKFAFVFAENRISPFDIKSGWPATEDLNSFDALLVLDTGTWSQLPGLKEILSPFKGPKIVVDHHLTQEDWPDIKLVVTTAAAAAEIVADLLERWGISLDTSIAAPLFWAIATDTGWFQYSNTTPKTMRLAAALMETGVDTERIYRLAYQNERAPRLALMARALASLELLAGNRLAVMSVTKADFEQTGAESSDTENFINLPMQVASVEVSAFLAEPLDAGPLRVSLRSKGAVDVAAFAHAFSNGKGGGHARAAGLKLSPPLADARRALSAALVKALT